MTTPKEGETRIVQSRFLIWPKIIAGEMYWLEHAAWVEKFTNGTWVAVEWWAYHPAR